MYYMFLGRMQIPIPPPKMQLGIKNKNKTINLINEGEVNLIKTAGLSEVQFEIMLPNQKYPFSQPILSFRKADYYIKQLKTLKISEDPFQFICIRMKPDGTMMSNTNLKVTLEDYQLKESADEGFDVIAAVKLKQFRDFGTKTIEVTKNDDGTMTGKVNSTRATTGHSIPTSITADGTKSCWQIAKKNLGSGDAVFKIAALNKIAIPAVVAAGEVLSLDV